MIDGVIYWSSSWRERQRRWESATTTDQRSTHMTDKQALHHLRLAMKGEMEAKRLVCMHIWEKFGWRMRGFFSQDPAVDLEDLRQSFWLGVLVGIERNKGLGDELYYLGQMGWWFCGAAVKKSEKHKRRSDRLDEDGEIFQQDEAWDVNADTEGIVIRRDYNRRIVTMLTSTVPDGTARRAMQAILSGAAGDPSELGINKRVAECLGVSPQRASQAMAKLRDYADQSGLAE